MRDKVLCVGWARREKPISWEVFSLVEKGYLSVLLSFFPPFSHGSVPVSVQGGVKMSLDSFLGFFDRNAAWRDQKAQREFMEQVSRQDLDTIFVAESLFRGTVVDFVGVDLSSRGGSHANNGFAIN